MRGKTVRYILHKHILGYLRNQQKATDQINNRLNQIEGNIVAFNETFNSRLEAIENSDAIQSTIDSLNSRIDALEAADSS